MCNNMIEIYDIPFIMELCFSLCRVDSKDMLVIDRRSYERMYIGIFRFLYSSRSQLPVADF